MSRNNVASLNILRKNKLTPTESPVVLSSSTSSVSDGWSYNEVQLPAKQPQIDFPYSFIIEGVVGGSQGMLAFDDVKMYTGACRGPPPAPGNFDCGNGQSIDASLVCDFKEDCSNGQDEKSCGTCDFEDPAMCGWTDKSDANGMFTWVRTRNGTVLGPMFDHTFYNSTGKKVDFKVG